MITCANIKQVKTFHIKKIVKPKPKEPVNICYILFQKTIVESMKPLFF